MTNFASLAPFVSGLSMGLLAIACSRSHHISTLDSDVFRYPPAMAWLMVILGFVFMSVAYWPGASGSDSPVAFFWKSSPAWGLAFVMAAYFFVYRVTVTADEISVGSFRKIRIPSAHMVDTYLPNGHKSKDLIVYLRSGKKVRLSGLLTDSKELWMTVELRVKRTPNGEGSPVKLRDEHLNNLTWKDYKWLSIGGPALIVVAAIAVYFVNRQ